MASVPKAHAKAYLRAVLLGEKSLDTARVLRATETESDHDTHGYAEAA